MNRTITCPRCGGLGVLPLFSHVDSGICYLCLGTGTIDITDGEKWTLCEFPMIQGTEFETKDLDIIMYSSDERGNYKRCVLSTKSPEWTTKVYFVLHLWCYELLHPQKAWDKMMELKHTKSKKEMAELINTEFARAESCPHMKSRYHLYNKDTNESVYCDKEGNPLKS